jgi:hypothetical protein
MNAQPARSSPAVDVPIATPPDWLAAAANDELAGMEITYLDVEDIELASTPGWGTM